jgi:hypothetical protein
MTEQNAPASGRAKKATPDKAGAARSEANGKPKHLKFRGLNLELPAELPETLVYDIVALRHAGDNPMPAFDILYSIVGQEQFFEIRNKIGITDDLSELFTKLFAKYGMTLGESSASQSS